ncbi:MAG: porin [Bradymonadia bacterium]
MAKHRILKRARQATRRANEKAAMMKAVASAALVAGAVMSTPAMAQEATTPATPPKAMPNHKTPTTPVAPPPASSAQKPVADAFGGQDKVDAMVDKPSNKGAAPAMAPMGMGPDGAAHVALDAAPVMSMGGWQVGWFGFMRVRAAFIDNDDQGRLFVGYNDGFVLGSARLGLEARRNHWRIRLDMDGAVDRGGNAESTATTLRDAFIAYEPMPWFNILAGQFKPAYDREELQSTRDLLFVSRAVQSRGVRAAEGQPVAGLSLSRNVGLMAYTQPLHLGPVWMSVNLSMVDGNGANRGDNDNEKFAYVGRLEVGHGDRTGKTPIRIEAGVGAMVNERDRAENPLDRITEERTGINADAWIEVYGAILNAQYMRQSTVVAGVQEEPETVAEGYHVALGYRAPMGITPAYRFSTFNPTAEFVADDPTVAQTLALDEVSFHTFTLNWEIPDEPIKLQLEYTRAIEKEGRELNNDRIEALIQARF